MENFQLIIKTTDGKFRRSLLPKTSNFVLISKSYQFRVSVTNEFSFLWSWKRMRCFFLVVSLTLIQWSQSQSATVLDCRSVLINGVLRMRNKSGMKDAFNCWMSFKNQPTCLAFSTCWRIRSANVFNPRRTAINSFQTSIDLRRIFHQDQRDASINIHRSHRYDRWDTLLTKPYKHQHLNQVVIDSAVKQRCCQQRQWLMGWTDERALKSLRYRRTFQPNETSFSTKMFDDDRCWIW